jgi:hypothetical protein
VNGDKLRALNAVRGPDGSRSKAQVGNGGRSGFARVVFKVPWAKPGVSRR